MVLAGIDFATLLRRIMAKNFVLRNNTRYDDEFIKEKLIFLLSNIEQEFYDELMSDNFNSIICYNTKDFFGVNFVK